MNSADDAIERSIAIKLLAADQNPVLSWEAKLPHVREQLSEEERRHPLGQWLLRVGDQLDWRDNVREFLVAYWHLPPQPFLATESEAAAYDAARDALLQNLQFRPAP
ncbi:MAG: hypothetical protein OWU84_13655 [Firmicutes bacterium]|nr:hypothetical protein [Bacillota bacterium]